MINRLRVVLDTNVLISALVFGGKPRKILELFAGDEIDIVFSEEIITEARRSIRGKFPDFIEEFEVMHSMLKEDAERVSLGSVTVQASRDPDDDRIIETGLIGRADYIISGDKDLLTLKSYNTLQIVSPGDFLSYLEK